MEETLQRVRTGGVTEAARDDTQGRFRRGDSVGFIEEQLVAWGEPEETLEVVLSELGREAELLTVPGATGELLEGDVVDELAALEVDLLVCGSRGYGPLRRVLLGGVSRRLIRRACSPLVMVPRGA
jgi:nucleotide-binding universal stress UspA family protein